MIILINKYNNDKFKWKNILLKFIPVLYHFDFCRQADSYVSKLHEHAVYLL